MERLNLLGQGLSSLQGIDHEAITLKSLNLHLNNFSNLSTFQQFYNLEELDVSSNQLKSLEGIEKLPNLKTLNLANNEIELVVSLENLKKLRHINLSYNNLKYLHGFLDLHGGEHNQVQVVELHGNKLEDVDHVVQCLCGLVYMKHLVLSWQGESNPLCEKKEYREAMFERLPQLMSLDHIDRENKMVDFTDDDLDMLEDMYDQLINAVPSEKSILSEPRGPEMKEPEVKLITTPSIDAVIKKRKNEPEKRKNISNSSTDYVSSAKNILTESSNNIIIQTSDSSFVEEVKKKPVNKLRKKLASSFHIAKTKRPPVREKVLAGCENCTFSEIYKELEAERDRRFKAEEANQKLLTELKIEKLEREKSANIKDMATETADRMKDVLVKQKKNNDLLRAQLKEQAGKQKELKSENTSLSDCLRETQSKLDKTETKFIEVKKFNENLKGRFNRKLRIAENEYNKIKESFNESCDVIKQMQDKITEFEKAMLKKDLDHKDTVSKLFSADSAEFHNAVHVQVNKEEKRHQQELLGLNQTIMKMGMEYKDLEDEFREALVIESNR